MTVEVESLMSTTWAIVEPTSVTRPTSEPPAPMTTWPTARPSSEPRSMTSDRRASDDSRAMTVTARVSYSEAVAELEQGRQQLVLTTELRRGAAVRVEQVVLRPKGRVLLAQGIDLRDGRGDRADLAGHPVDRLPGSA